MLHLIHKSNYLLNVLINLENLNDINDIITYNCILN